MLLLLCHQKIQNDEISSLITMSDVEKQALAGGYGGLDIHDQEKQGQTCLGCCCDMRRAVIIISIMSLSLSAISLVFLLGFESLRMATQDAFDDDVLLETIEHSYLVQSIFVGIGLVPSMCSLVGGIQYNVYLVGINIVWLITEYIATIVNEMLAFLEIEESYAGTQNIKMPWVSWVISAIISALFIYPLVRFIREINLGIMSRETYPREEFSCCCTRRHRTHSVTTKEDGATRFRQQIV
jgi:hypothetical protein